LPPRELQRLRRTFEQSSNALFHKGAAIGTFEAWLELQCPRGF